MKKFKLLFLLVLFMFIIPNVYAAEDVKIESINIADKSEDVEEITPASFNGLDINLDIRFINEMDHIKYDVLVVNNSNKDYKITNKTKFGESDHIKYEYSYNSGNSIVKANSKQSMQIDITYARKVDPTELDANGRFTENKNMVVSLSRGTTQITNPKTNSLLMLLIVMAIIIVFVPIIAYRKNNKLTAMLLLVSLLLPTSILALDELQIKVNSKVTINSIMDFCVIDYGLSSKTPIKATNEIRGAQDSIVIPDKYDNYINNTYRYKVMQGMTFEDFENSKYFDQVGKEIPKDEEYYNLYDNTSNLSNFYVNERSQLEVLTINTERFKTIEKSDIIKSCDEAVYRVLYSVQE